MSKRLCYGCKRLFSRWDGSGGTTYLCNMSPGLVVGYVSAFEDDDPVEVNECHTSRQAANNS